MTAWALRASLLIVLESHAGQWCTLGFLAGRVIAPAHTVRPLCDALVTAGQVQRAVYYGEPIYGVHVVTEHAGIRDVRDICDGDAELGLSVDGGPPR